MKKSGVVFLLLLTSYYLVGYQLLHYLAVVNHTASNSATHRLLLTKVQLAAARLNAHELHWQGVLYDIISCTEQGENCTLLLSSDTWEQALLTGLSNFFSLENSSRTEKELAKKWSVPEFAQLDAALVLIGLPTPVSTFFVTNIWSYSSPLLAGLSPPPWSMV